MDFGRLLGSWHLLGRSPNPQLLHLEDSVPRLCSFSMRTRVCACVCVCLCVLVAEQQCAKPPGSEVSTHGKNQFFFFF